MKNLNNSVYVATHDITKGVGKKFKTVHSFLKDLPTSLEDDNTENHLDFLEHFIILL